MKKILLICLTAALLLAMFAGCSKVPGDASADVKGKITFVNHRTDMMEGKWAEYGKKFTEKYPNATVEFEAMKDYEGDIAVRMNSTEYGDVLMMSAKMKDADLPSFFTVLGKKSELEQKYNFVTDRYIGDDVYGISIDGNVSGIVYNKKVFADAGVTSLPKTPEEFIAALKLIKKNTKAIPLYTNYHDSWALNQWEAYRTNVAGDPAYVNQILPHSDEPFAKDRPHYIVYKLLFDAVKEGLVEPDPMTTDWETSKQRLANGEIATMPLGSWAVGQCKAFAKNPDDVAYMPFPYTKDGKMYTAAAGDYKICINKNTKNPAAAKAFVNWFLDESNYAFNEALIPPLKSADFPATLKGFQELGVIMLTEAGPKDGENGWLDAIDKQSEVGLWNENFKKDIVETALGNKKGRTFDDIMNGLNKKWSETRKKLIAAGTIGQ